MNPYKIIFHENGHIYLIPNDKLSEFNRENKEVCKYYKSYELERDFDFKSIKNTDFIYKSLEFEEKWNEYGFDLDVNGEMQIYVDNTTNDEIKSKRIDIIR